MAAAVPEKLARRPVDTISLKNVMGLATRLGFVALLCGGGLAVIFFNSESGKTIGERLKRAAETGTVFGDPVPSTEQSSIGRVRDPIDGPAAGSDQRVAKLVPLASPELLSAPSAVAADFVRLAMVNPKRICKAIDPGANFMTWKESALLTGQWECYATATTSGERVPVKTDIEDGGVTEDPEAVFEPSLPDKPQLFVMARGTDRDALATVRIKLVSDSAAKAARGGKRLAELTGSLFDALQWQAPDGLMEKLKKLENFEIDQAGTRIRFKRELSQGWQFNLIVLFPDYSKYRRASAFHDQNAKRGDAGAIVPSVATTVAPGEP